jgi:hypothetical protein
MFSNKEEFRNWAIDNLSINLRKNTLHYPVVHFGESLEIYRTLSQWYKEDNPKLTPKEIQQWASKIFIILREEGSARIDNHRKFLIPLYGKVKHNNYLFSYSGYQAVKRFNISNKTTAVKSGYNYLPVLCNQHYHKNISIRIYQELLNHGMVIKLEKGYQPTEKGAPYMTCKLNQSNKTTCLFKENLFIKLMELIDFSPSSPHQQSVMGNTCTLTEAIEMQGYHPDNSWTDSVVKEISKAFDLLGYTIRQGKKRVLTEKGIEAGLGINYHGQPRYYKDSEELHDIIEMKIPYEEQGDR